MNDRDLDRLFAALSNPRRRRMVDLLVERGPMRPGDVALQFRVSRVAVLKHLAVLERAKLITSERVGRERWMTFNPVPVQLVRDRWLDRFDSFWAERVADLKVRLEQPAQHPQAGPGARAERTARHA